MTPQPNQPLGKSASVTDRGRAALKVAAQVQKSAGQDFLQQWRSRPVDPATYDKPAIWLISAYLVFTTVLIAVLFDTTAAHAARQAPDPWRSFFVFVTDFGKSGYLFLFSALTCASAVAVARLEIGVINRAAMGLLAGRALFVFSVLLGSGIASLVLKRIGRARPKLLEQGGAFQFEPLSLTSTWASMPSGHTITVFAVAMALGYFLPKWRVPLLLAAALIGASRVMVGAHYPSDVVAGACIGVASAVLLRRLFAVRGIVFKLSDGAIIPRGRGVIIPALRSIAKS